MRMIDVLNLQAESKIDFGTKLIVTDKDDIFEYIDYKGGSFIDEYGFEIDVYYTLDKDFLNLEVELVLPEEKTEEKKYLVHINLLSHSRMRHLVFLSIIDEKGQFKNHFTKSELQSIQAVRDYLEVIQGNYELIEVTDDESMDC